MIISATAPPPCLPRSTSSTAPWSAAVCRATPTRNSSSSSMLSSVPSGPARSSMPSPTTTPRTSIHPSNSGSPTTRDGSSISPRPPPPGSTPSRASSQLSPAGASDAASSNLSPTSRTPSAAIFASTTGPQNPSSGPNQPTPSSPNLPACLYLPNESVH